jgi:DNA-binding response OmpR family regulator
MARTMLVIDDSAHARQVCRLAGRSVGVETLEARDAFEGRRAALEGGHGLMLVSSSLPGSDGLTLLEHLRGVGVTTPAALIAPACAGFDGAALASLGVLGVLARPLDARGVVSMLEGASRRAA